MFDAEGPQILGWALRCAARAVSAGTMQTRATMEASKQWRKTEDSVLDAFMGSESCFKTTGSAEDRLAASLAFQDYQRFTQDVGRKPLGRNQFYDRIKSSQDLSAVGVTIVEDRKGQKFITGVRAQRELVNRGIEQLRASMPKPVEPKE
jgi:NAD(P)H-nitrite reductase large subunit